MRRVRPRDGLRRTVPVKADRVRNHPLWRRRSALTRFSCVLVPMDHAHAGSDHANDKEGAEVKPSPRSPRVDDRLAVRAERPSMARWFVRLVTDLSLSRLLIHI